MFHLRLINRLRELKKSLENGLTHQTAKYLTEKLYSGTFLLEHGLLLSLLYLITNALTIWK